MAYTAKLREDLRDIYIDQIERALKTPVDGGGDDSEPPPSRRDGGGGNDRDYFAALYVLAVQQNLCAIERTFQQLDTALDWHGRIWGLSPIPVFGPTFLSALTTIPVAKETILLGVGIGLASLSGATLIVKRIEREWDALTVGHKAVDRSKDKALERIRAMQTAMNTRQSYKVKMGDNGEVIDFSSPTVNQEYVIQRAKKLCRYLDMNFSNPLLPNRGPYYTLNKLMLFGDVEQRRRERFRLG